MLEQNTARFYETMEILAPESSDSGFVYRWDDEFCKAALHLRQIRDQRKKLDKEEREVRESLIQLSNGRNSKGMGFTVSKVVVKGSIDYSLVEELKGVDLEKYRKPNIESWRVA